MVNFLQQRGDLYSSHPLLPAEDNITATLDKDAAQAKKEADDQNKKNAPVEL